jgi:hypothetical protein
MHKSATTCNKTLSKWCKNKHGASKIIDTFETYQCGEDQREQLKGVIGIASEALTECYLGLPTVVGRSKDGCFQYLTERSWGKVKGLKAQGLSKAGKENLVKSVLQAVPGYTMSCFQLTKKQCQKLSSVSVNFWWGDKDGQRKVHWIRWDRM